MQYEHVFRNPRHIQYIEMIPPLLYLSKPFNSKLLAIVNFLLLLKKFTIPRFDCISKESINELRQDIFSTGLSSCNIQIEGNRLEFDQNPQENQLTKQLENIHEHVVLCDPCNKVCRLKTYVSRAWLLNSRFLSVPSVKLAMFVD